MLTQQNRQRLRDVVDSRLGANRALSGGELADARDVMRIALEAAFGILDDLHRIADAFEAIAAAADSIAKHGVKVQS